MPDSPVNAPTGHAIEADIQRAMEMIRDAPYTACVGGNEHIIGPDDLKRAAVATCAGCGYVMVVNLDDD